MKLIVDHSSRFAKMRAHTATHLLHSQLAKIFPNTKQEWSQVDNDYLRFDFSSDRLLDQSEIANIEKKINQIIYLACDVTTQEMNITHASKLWAKMFFEDKYGDSVRVVQITSHSEHSEESSFESIISIELCWWTHVENTKDIWCFSIIWQEAVASGIKRITALTWPRVSEKIQEIQSILDITVNKLWIKTPTQLQDKLDKTMREYADMQSKIESLEEILTKKEKDFQSFKINENFKKIYKLPDILNFRTSVFFMSKDIYHENVFICNQQWNFAIISWWGEAKELAKKLWLKWWGDDKIFQWKSDIAKDIYDNAEEIKMWGIEVDATLTNTKLNMPPNNNKYTLKSYNND